MPRPIRARRELVQRGRYESDVDASLVDGGEGETGQPVRLADADAGNLRLNPRFAVRTATLTARVARYDDPGNQESRALFSGLPCTHRSRGGGGLAPHARKPSAIAAIVHRNEAYALIDQVGVVEDPGTTAGQIESELDEVRVQGTSRSVRPELASVGTSMDPASAAHPTAPYGATMVAMMRGIAATAALVPRLS